MSSWKYKHKPTGAIVEYMIGRDDGTYQLVSSNKNSVHLNSYFFPKWLIENSCDWELVKEPILYCILDDGF